MNILVIKEFGNYKIPSTYELDLNSAGLKFCLGCACCWFKTPGKCVHQDLNSFFPKYLSADKVIVFSKVSKGFVSSKLKNLFDRMLPLYLPNIDVSTGESRHVPRYDKYPDIEVYYEGNFTTDEDRKIYEDYVYRTFNLFESKIVTVKPISEFNI